MTDIKELLPLGSVVRVDGTEPPMMIIGVKQYCGVEDRDYDYLGVRFPEGSMGMETQYLFDQSQITELVFRGYEDESSRKFLDDLSAWYTDHAEDAGAENHE